MELTKAIEVLRGSVALKQSEIDSLSLAIEILEDRFSPELEVLNNARAEVAQKEEIIIQKTAEIENVSSEKTALETRVKELEDSISNVEEVTPKVETEELPVEELPI